MIRPLYEITVPKDAGYYTEKILNNKNHIGSDKHYAEYFLDYFGMLYCKRKPHARFGGV